MSNIDPENYDKLSPQEAIDYQKFLRTQVNIRPLDKEITTIAGADISFNKFSDTVYAGIIVLSFPELKEIDRSTVVAETRFPYISGLLAFREIPALLKAWEQLKVKPDLLVLDGQGIAHGRRMGIATHFGLLKDVPTIGSAKSRLTGIYDEPGNAIFDTSPMFDKGEQVGTALRSKKNCKPIFVSPGHKVSLAQSVEIIKKCVGKYRIPEPTRLAHNLVNQVRVEALGGNQPLLF